MAGENKDEGGSGTGSMTLEQVVATISELAPQVAKLTEAFNKLKPLEEAEHGVSLDKDKPDAAAGGESTPAGASMDKDPMPAAMDEAAFVKRIAKRDSLAKAISAHVGTFDHAEKTLDEVVAYGCEKLGVKAEKGHEAAALDGFLQARPAKLPAAIVTGLDAKGDAPAVNFVTRYLGGK